MHFQNGITEKRIWDLQEQVRTMLPFAVHKWPRMLSMALWPYALQTANEVRNTTPMESQTKHTNGAIRPSDNRPKAQALPHFQMSHIHPRQ